jgi:hypothetical protein
MTQNHQPPDHNTLLDDAWGQVVGGMDWLKSVFFGEFADYRPLSAVVADMLVSFLPGVVIVTSARDAVAVLLRLANHPEKREDLMEWVLLCSCMIVIALPIAMAAGGAAAAGVGAVVGGIAGSELGAALRAVMLLLIKEANKLVEMVRFLQKFMKGDILKFLRAVKFAKYEKALVQALAKISGKLVEMVKTLRVHLESLRYFDTVKASIAKLAAWEKKFYNVQQDALKQIPRALAELDARLGKVLAETAPKEVHTVASGVQADKAAAALPPKQRVRDTPGKVLAKVEDEAPKASVGPKTSPKPTAAPKAQPTVSSPPPLKDKPDPVKPPDEGANAKKQAVADAAAAADRELITKLSNESRDARAAGDIALADKKLEQARDILRPHLPKRPSDSWDEVIKRLDVSSPKDGAVFWSGSVDAAKRFANERGGVTLETTAGGRLIDKWEDLDPYNWDPSKGSPPYSKTLWEMASENYAKGATGHINTVQTPDRIGATYTLWHNVEMPEILKSFSNGKVTEITMHVLDDTGKPVPLSRAQMNTLLRPPGG